MSDSMVHDSLESVNVLDDASLRRLWVEGDAQERVWANWVLGMRLGSAGAELFEARYAEEPDLGVKRHLLVVLAGFGRVAFVGSRAAKEADADSRATATAMLARIVDVEDDEHYDVLLSRTLDLAWQVRHAVASTISSKAPPWVMEAVSGLLSDPDSLVREALRVRIEDGEFDRRSFERTLAWLDASVSSRRAEVQRLPSPSTALVRYRRPPEEY